MKTRQKTKCNLKKTASWKHLATQVQELGRYVCAKCGEKEPAEKQMMGRCRGFAWLYTSKATTTKILQEGMLEGRDLWERDRLRVHQSMVQEMCRLCKAQVSEVFEKNMCRGQPEGEHKLEQVFYRMGTLEEGYVPTKHSRRRKTQDTL